MTESINYSVENQLTASEAKLNVVTIKLINER